VRAASSDRHLGLAFHEPNEPMGLTIRYKVAQTPGLPTVSAPPREPVTEHTGRLQFRLVAEEGDPSLWERFADPNDKSGQSLIPVLKEVLLDDSSIISASATGSPVGNAQIAIQFSDSGARRFAEITGTNVGRKLAIVFDGKVLSAPTINMPIHRRQGGHRR